MLSVYRKVIVKKIITLTTFFIFLSSSVSYGVDMSGYMQSLMGQIKGAVPTVYHSQMGGGFVGGSIHIPPLGQTIHPFSVSLPKISNTSCGGINVMLGSFSYLGFKYLIKKLQMIIQAAPALAFEIAIKVLSQQLGINTDVLENMTNALNGLNFNSCTAMNGIVTTASNAITSAINGGAMSSSQEQAQGSKDMFSTGIEDTLHDIKKGITKFFGQFKDLFGGSAAAHTPKEKRSIENKFGIPKDGLLNGISEQLGVNLPNGFLDTLRFYVGDVEPVDLPESDNASGDDLPSPAGNYIAGCADIDQFVKDVTAGKIYQITFNQLHSEDCSVATVKTGKPFVDTVKEILQGIEHALEFNEDLSANAQYVNFINMAPVPVYTMMKTAVLAGGSAAPSLCDKLAEPIAYAITAEVTRQFVQILMRGVSSAQADLKQGVSPNASAIKAEKEFMEHLRKMSMALTELEDAKFNETKAVYGSWLQQYHELQQELQAKAARIYNLNKAMTFQKTVR